MYESLSLDHSLIDASMTSLFSLFCLASERRFREKRRINLRDREAAQAMARREAGLWPGDSDAPRTEGHYEDDFDFFQVSNTFIYHLILWSFGPWMD